MFIIIKTIWGGGTISYKLRSDATLNTLSFILVLRLLLSSPLVLSHLFSLGIRYFSLSRCYCVCFSFGFQAHSYSTQGFFIFKSHV